MPDLITPADVVDRKLLARADLAALISAASGMAERRCNWDFVLATLTEAYDGTNAPRVWLCRTPVISVASVSINGQDLDNTNGDAWTFRPDTGELRRGLGRTDQRFAYWFPKGLQNVVVTYTGGFAAIPADLKMAAVILVKHLADSLKNTGVYGTEKIGDYSYTLADPAVMAFPPLAESILKNYER